MFDDKTLGRIGRTVLALAVLALAPSMASAISKDKVAPPAYGGTLVGPSGTTLPAPANAPDLVVLIQKVSCSWGYLQLKVRLQNNNDTPAQGPFTTTVKMNGVDFPMTPKIYNGQLTGGHVFHATFPAVADGTYTAETEIDSGGQVNEQWENNNVTIVQDIQCLDQTAENSGTPAAKADAAPAARTRPGTARPGAMMRRR